MMTMEEQAETSPGHHGGDSIAITDLHFVRYKIVTDALVVHICHLLMLAFGVVGQMCIVFM